MDISHPTLTHHVLRQKATVPGARGLFSAVLVQLASACKRIAGECRRAGLGSQTGTSGATGHHGDEVKRLDAFANEAICSSFDHSGLAAAIVTEEMEAPYVPLGDASKSAEYVLCFDPIDGSSNIDVNVTVGTIFSVRRRADATRPPRMEDLLVSGRSLLAAGYVLYGPSTVLVLATDRGVDLFTQDPVTGDFLLTDPGLTIPSRGPTYSVNEANSRKWEDPVRRLVESLREGRVGSITGARYVGSLVSDFHRTLLRGGLFLYPGDRKKPEGKIRLLYESIPLSWIAEKAGGRGSDGKTSILDLQPEFVHQRTPYYVGGAEDMADVERLLAGTGG
jgi:fructose-1,6-bisphosphatase I